MRATLGAVHLALLEQVGLGQTNYLVGDSQVEVRENDHKGMLQEIR